jgi:hypothetical protein
LSALLAIHISVENFFVTAEQPNTEASSNFAVLYTWDRHAE